MLKFTIRDRVTNIVMVELSDRLTKWLGNVTTTPGVASSLTVAGDETIGEVWFSAQILGAEPRINMGAITVSGNTLSWPAMGQPVFIQYGRW